MFSKLFKFGPFFAKVEAVVEHDVEAIIADFTHTVTKLEAAAAAKLKEAEQAAAEAELAHFRAGLATAASEKATKVAGQIKALVS